MFDFSGKTALITGAAGNLGQAAADSFRQAGAALVLVDHRLEQLQKTFPDLCEDKDVRMFGIDLTRQDEVEKLSKEVSTAAGGVDFLINIAGGYKAGSPVYETEIKTWDFMLNLNAKSVLLMSREFVPMMIERGEGKIVNIAARAGLGGSARMGAYVVSKSAVIRLTESLSAEVKSKGINVNCILPGTIDTPQNRESMPKADFDKLVPPARLASVIAFLCSEAAAAIHGASIPVYGLS